MKNIYTNGVVYTVTNGVVEAFVEEGGVFIYVGNNAGAMEFQESDSVVRDLNGQFVTAGFNDSHLHTVATGRALNLLNLSEAKSINDLIESGQDYLQKQNIKEGEWLVGFSWNQDYFAEKRFPTREDLDKISTKHPIYLTRACGHVAVVNSMGIEVLGITKDTQVEGGAFDVDDSGELSGILKEKALEIAKSYVSPMKDLKKYIQDGVAYCNSFGITSLQTDDFCASTTIDYKDVIKAYTELELENALNIRIYQQSQFPTIDVYEQFINDGYRTGYGTSRFKIGPLKMLLDGSLGARTALLNAPYSDDPTNSGMSLYSGEELDQWFKLARKHDMQIACHAIGDGAAYILLDAYERILSQHPQEDHRYGVVHAQITDLHVANKMADLGILAYIQSIFIDYDSNIVYDRVGERANTSYIFKTLRNKGVRIPNGSDSPIEWPNVFAGMQTAVTRTSLRGGTPYLVEEGLSIEEAIHSYTIDGAYASFEEEQKGSIEVGKFADFVILSQNLLEIDPYDIHKTFALETYIDGELVYSHQ